MTRCSRLEWSETPLPAGEDETLRVVLVSEAALADGTGLADVAAAALAGSPGDGDGDAVAGGLPGCGRRRPSCRPRDDLTKGADAGLVLAKAFLADERFADSRLVVVTNGAVAVGERRVARALSGAAVGPGAKAPSPSTQDALSSLDADESEAAHALPSAACKRRATARVCARALLVLRIARVLTPATGNGPPPLLDPDGTGAHHRVDGRPGSAVARHFAERQGVKRLLLVQPPRARRPGVQKN